MGTAVQRYSGTVVQRVVDDVQTDRGSAVWLMTYGQIVAQSSDFFTGKWDASREKDIEVGGCLFIQSVSVLLVPFVSLVTSAFPLAFLLLSLLSADCVSLFSALE